MKMLPQFLCLLAALTFATGPSLRAQYNPPPPPDQQQAAPDQGAPPPDQQPPMGQDQGAPPPDQQPPMGQDQGAPPPDQAMGGDQGAPPSDGQQAPPPDDQGAPPPDDGSASDNGGGDANFQTFYNDLSSQGTWVQTGNYGYAWQPNVQDPDWAPYQNGHWVYTDEGWTWVADASEPWGWATYHYGRWVNIDGEGWVWVPGYTWAPAWVSWRYGGGYCGWAPLPPDTFVGIDFGGTGFGFHIGGDCDTAYGIGPGYYNFISIGFLGDRSYRGHYRNRNDNFGFIGNTRNVTNIVVNNQRGAGRFGRVTAGGPNFATVNAQSHTPVQRATLARSNRVGASTLSGNRLAVFAPHVNAAAAGTTLRPRTVGGTLSNVRVNRGTSISDPVAVNSRLRPTAASAQQVEAARTAEAHAPASAHIATSNTRPTNELSRPLTSFQPHSSVRSAGAVHAATTTSGAASHTMTHTTSAADRAFTGEATGAPVSEAEARRESAARSRETTAGTESHTEVHSSANNNAEAERAQREQTDRAQSEREQSQRTESQHEVEHAQTEHPQVEHASEHAPVQHEVEHAAVSHEAQHAAAPQQHAAPHPSGGGGGGGQHAAPSGGGGNKPNH